MVSGQGNVDKQPPMKTRFFALFFVIVGLALAYVMAGQILEALAPYGWQKTDCLIKRSDVLYDAKELHACSHSLEYQYVVSGERKTGSTWRIDPGVPPAWCSAWASHASDFPPTTTVACYVDPRNPDRAVLDRGNLFSIFKLILPIGLVGIGIAIFRRTSSLFPPSKAAVKRLGRWIAVCVLLAGAIGTLFAGVLPLLEAFGSRTWNKAECEVLSSRLRTSSSGSAPGSATRNRGYDIDIVFTYAVNGRNYVSDRYDFSSFGSGSADSLARITDRYPAGAKVSCAVRADNPYAAVLVPGLSAENLWGFLPLLAVAIGFCMLVAIRRID